MTPPSPPNPSDEPPHFSIRLAQTKATLERIAREFSPAIFASSLAAEDMVLTDLILKNKLDIAIFSIDTGRLPMETLAMVEQINKTYGYQIIVFYPNSTHVADYIEKNGFDGFYASVKARQQCCHIRKVEPLERALEGNKAWITGQRRSQSETRAHLQEQEVDVAHGMAKFNPLIDWSVDDVWFYIRRQNVPYNPLHDAGYPSIGCAPCTRAVKPGEDIRAGRWWWELPEHRECGLHLVDGKLARKSTP